MVRVWDGRGRLRWLAETKIPVRDAAGHVAGLVGIARDITGVKEAEERLRESERRFRAIFDSTFQFMGLLAPDGTLLEGNRTALDAIGARREDVVGRPFWETPWWAHSPALQERLRDAVRRAAAGETVRFEAEHVTPAGPIVVDFSLKPVCDETGQVVMMIPESRDITERKRAEERLRQGEQRYRSLVEATTAIVWNTPASGEFETEQPGWSAFTGQTFAQLRGWGWLDAVHPDDRPLTARAWSAAVAGRTLYKVEHRLRRSSTACAGTTARTAS